jgi:prevent-host-death family protein
VTVIKEVGAAHLADLVKQVQAGNEVLLTQGDKPVARIVSAHAMEAGNGAALRIRSLKGHRVLAPTISQGELAEEMFGQP